VFTALNRQARVNGYLNRQVQAYSLSSIEHDVFTQGAQQQSAFKQMTKDARRHDGCVGRMQGGTPSCPLTFGTVAPITVSGSGVSKRRRRLPAGLLG
jgi:hypothetical protein